MVDVEMTTPLHRKKRSKAIRILFAPIIALVFLVGWSFYCIGQSGKKKQKIAKTTSKPENVHLMAIPLQEEQTITN
jgi:flagellar basal body-associated protein FliL